MHDSPRQVEQAAEKEVRDGQIQHQHDNGLSTDRKAFLDDGTHDKEIPRQAHKEKEDKDTRNGDAIPLVIKENIRLRDYPSCLREGVTADIYKTGEAFSVVGAEELIHLVARIGAGIDYSYQVL